MKWIVTIAVMISLSGCAAMLPSIEAQHPVGYSKLISIVPECKSPDLKSYSSCLAASQMLESTSPQQVTVRFLAHWESTAFGMADRKQKAGETLLAPEGLMHEGVWGSVKRDEIMASTRIDMPVLKKIYSSSPDEYSKTMLSQVDLVILDSRSSFDTFREVHTKLITSMSNAGSR